MKTTTFDLELALAGYPLVTRGGFEVTEFKEFELISPDYYHRYAGIVKEYVGGELHEFCTRFAENGSWLIFEESEYDLFMLVEE